MEQSSWQHGAQLLEKIDAVLAECGEAPVGRRWARPSGRPPWRGPSWLQDETADGNGHGHGSEQRRT